MDELHMNLDESSNNVGRINRNSIMHKIFISCPFNKFVKESLFVDQAFRQFTEELYEICLKYTPEVFLALKREEYGSKPLLVYSCSLDLDEMKNADLIIAIPDDSMGVAVELGWASAMEKNILLVLDKEQNYTPLVLNINQITPGKVIWHEGVEASVLPAIRDFIETFTE